MKKTLNLLFLLLAVFAISSCSSDDDEKKDSVKEITIYVSSETGEGIEEIRQIIEELSCREEENDAPSDAQADSKAVPEETIGFGQAENTDDMEEAIRRFRESVRSGELEKKQQEKLPTRQRQKGETCL